MEPSTIIFVCTSNTCRSPIASALASKYLYDNKLNNKYMIISRGLSNEYEPENSLASLHGINTLKNDYNIDISNHRSMLLNDNDMNNATTIIGVTQSHYNEIIKRYPSHSNKVTKLAHDVQDPWHQPIEAYQHTAITLSKLINDIMMKIT